MEVNRQVAGSLSLVQTQIDLAKILQLETPNPTRYALLGREEHV